MPNFTITITDTDKLALDTVINPHHLGIGTWTQGWVGPCTNRTVCGVTPWELESASTAGATSSRGSPSATPVAHLPHHRPCGALLIVQARAPSAGRPLMASMMIVAPPLTTEAK